MWSDNFSDYECAYTGAYPRFLSFLGVGEVAGKDTNGDLFSSFYLIFFPTVPHEIY